MKQRVSWKQLSTEELLRFYGRTMTELRERGVVRSSNNPVADYAEYLISRTLGLDLVTRSTKGHDGVDGEGHRYEVKGRRLTARNKSRGLSVIRELGQERFDYLAGVLFKEDFTIFRSCIIPHAVVAEQATYREYVNGWILHLRDSVFALKGVVDITDRVAATARGEP